MRHRLRAPPQIAALIGGLHPQIKKKVPSVLERILSNPLCGKALKDKLDGLRSFRVGRFASSIASRRVVWSNLSRSGHVSGSTKRRTGKSPKRRIFSRARSA